MLSEMHEDGPLSRDNPKGVGVCVCVYTVSSSVRFCASDVVNVDFQASPQYSVVERTVLCLGCVKGCGKRVTKR